MGALDAVVRSGKALYVGISNYTSDQTAQAAAILQELGTPLLLHQPSYSMLNRWTEKDHLLDTLERNSNGLRDVRIHQMHVLHERAYLRGECGDHLRHVSYFLSAATRPASAACTLLRILISPVPLFTAIRKP